MDTMLSSDVQQRLEALHEQRTALQNEILALQAEAAAMPVRDYELHDPDGNPVRLSELFGAGDQLILVHNMGFRCSYCTMWADGFNALHPYIQRRAAFVVVSNDTPEQQKRGAELRGWTFPLYTARGTSLFLDLGFEQDGNYWPGVSTLVKDADGLRRHSSAIFGPGDVFNPAWHFFDLLERNDESIEPTAGLGQTAV